MLSNNDAVSIEARVRIFASSLYPELVGKIILGRVGDVLSVLVMEPEQYAGREFLGIPGNYELLEPEAAVSNTPPDSQSRSRHPNQTKIPSAIQSSNLSSFPVESVVNPASWSGKGFQPKSKKVQGEDRVLRALRDSDSETQIIGDGLRVHVDWLAGVGRTNDPNSFFSYLGKCIGQEILVEEGVSRKVGRVWENSFRSASGVIGMFQELRDKSAWEVYLSIPGSVLSSRPVRHWHKMSRVLRKKIQFRATRFDVALDDYHKSIAPIQVTEAIRAGNVTGFKPGKDSGGRFIESFGEGWTVQMGAPKSARKLNYYNKQAESKGKLDCYRWETRSSGDLASQQFDDWLSLPEEDFDSLSARYLGAVVVGTFDFIDRAVNPKEKNVSRLKKLPWWETFVARVGSEIRHSRIRSKRSIQKAMQWIERQVVTSLAMLQIALGSSRFADWLSAEMIRAKEKRFTDWHHHLIRVHRAEVEVLESA